MSAGLPALILGAIVFVVGLFFARRERRGIPLG